MLFRIFAVANAIRNRGTAKPGLTALQLAREFSVCDKTIRRDIELLKDLGAPITFDYGHGTWLWNVLLDAPWYFGGTITNPKLPPDCLRWQHHYVKHR